MTTFLLTHIIIALSSVAYTSYLYFRPSRNGLRLSYSLVSLTLATGTYLVFLNPVSLAKTCLTGLIYVGIVLVGIVAARHKLAEEPSRFE